MPQSLMNRCISFLCSGCTRTLCNRSQTITLKIGVRYFTPVDVYNATNGCEKVENVPLPSACVDAQVQVETIDSVSKGMPPPFGGFAEYAFGLIPANVPLD